MAAFVQSASRNGGIVARIVCRPGLFRIHLASFARVVLACPLLLAWASSEALGAESTPTAPPATQSEQTNAPDAIVAYLQLHEQLHATQLAIERSLLETKVAVAQNAESWSKGLQAVQDALAAQRQRDKDAMQRSNRVVFVAVGTVAAAGFLFLLLIVYFQWCMSRGLAEISILLPIALRQVYGAAMDALDPSDQAAVSLLGATETQQPPPREPDQPSPPGLRPRRGIGWSIERRLFPNPGDSRRKRQFRSLMVALLCGLMVAVAMALVLYLLYKAPRN
jgi:hypothetical protein